ncbi:MAG: primosomal protein N' [Pseudomonadota bacterium]
MTSPVLDSVSQAAQEQYGPGQRLRILVPLPIGTSTGGAYDYWLPDHVPRSLELAVGHYVEVPVGKRQMPGIIWEIDPEPDANSDTSKSTPGTPPTGKRKRRVTLKPVMRVFDLPPMSVTNRKMIRWMAQYYGAPMGAVLKMFLASPAALETPEPTMGYRRLDPMPTGLRLTPARRRVLSALAEDIPVMTASELAKAAGCGTSVVKSLAAQGGLETVTLPALPPRDARPDWTRPGPTLSPDQQAAADRLRDTVNAGEAYTAVIDGVTGSGKTEVYQEAIAATLAKGQQVLVLLPEISLSAQWLDRFAQRFGATPTLWNSELTPATRRDNWRNIALGRADVVVGARSALFLPYDRLGLIIVDEEHDASFKQEDRVAYNARDMALVRGQLAGHPVVLASATPSMETMVNMDEGRFEALVLPERHGAAQLPEIQLIDLTKTPPTRLDSAEPDGNPVAELGPAWLAPPLVDALADTLEKGEQSLLFLNRRGYAPLTLCQSCGHRWQCPNCTAWLVEHRLAHRLQCHHCGFEGPLPSHCPSGGAEDSIIACGPGVERVAEEVQQRFPSARVGLLTSDMLTGAHAMREFIAKIQTRAIDIVIGTQILAKGHHFPLLTLVGIIDADMGLGGGDIRAPERSFQLLQQVAGRAGRGDSPGTVMVQTRLPHEPVLQALANQDRDGFMDVVEQERRLYEMPPFGRLAALIISDPNEGRLRQAVNALANVAPKIDGVTILGPAPAALSMLRGRHRQRFLIKAGRKAVLARLIEPWLQAVKLPSQTRVQIDIDPYSFL